MVCNFLYHVGSIRLSFIIAIRSLSLGRSLFSCYFDYCLLIIVYFAFQVMFAIPACDLCIEKFLRHATPVIRALVELERRNGVRDNLTLVLEVLPVCLRSPWPTS